MKKISQMSMSQISGGVSGTTCFLVGLGATIYAPFTAGLSLFAASGTIRACWNS